MKKVLAVLIFVWVAITPETAKSVPLSEFGSVSYTYSKYDLSACAQGEDPFGDEDETQGCAVLLETQPRRSVAYFHIGQADNPNQLLVFVDDTHVEESRVFTNLSLHVNLHFCPVGQKCHLSTQDWGFRAEYFQFDQTRTLFESVDGAGTLWLTRLGDGDDSVYLAGTFDLEMTGGERFGNDWLVTMTDGVLRVAQNYYGPVDVRPVDPGHYSNNDGYYYNYEDRGCYGVWVEDDDYYCRSCSTGSSSDSGCGGDDFDDSGSSSSGGCSGDTYDSGSGSDGGCEGDTYDDEDDSCAALPQLSGRRYGRIVNFGINRLLPLLLASLFLLIYRAIVVHRSSQARHAWARDQVDE